MKNLQNYIKERRLQEREDMKMLYEMASVGYFTSQKSSGKPKGMEMKVFINGSEGNIPHMHIWDNDTNGQKFHTCVCLTTVDYFHHTGKEGVLSSKQKSSLVDFLKSECKNRRYKTNWEYALSMWNDNNQTSTQVDEESELLDYTQLP